MRTIQCHCLCACVLLPLWLKWYVWYDLTNLYASINFDHSLIIVLQGISKRYSCLKLLLNFLKLFLKFLLNGPHKNTVLFVWNFQICCVFANMGPYGRKSFKTLLLLQIDLETFRSSLEYSSQWPSHKNTVLFFLNFDFLIFSSALCYWTAELLSSCGHPSVVCPSVKPVFSETVKRINAKFGKYYLFTISPDHFFLFFKS